MLILNDSSVKVGPSKPLSNNILIASSSVQYKLKSYKTACLREKKFVIQKLHSTNAYQDFLGGPVVKTSPSNTGGAGSNPSQGAKISHMPQGQKPKHETEAVL